MKPTMVIPTYWDRKTSDQRRDSDTVYDHPTQLDRDGTLLRLLNSLSILKNKDFHLVILGAATGKDIRQKTESRLNVLLKQASSQVKATLFSYSHLEKIHDFLKHKNLHDFIPLLQLDGYSNIRNLCVFLPHILDSETAVLIDDDEIFEDPDFMDKALENMGKTFESRPILAVAGYYVNPDGDFMLHREKFPWMTHWDKIGSMNRAFSRFIAEGPRLKKTPFVFGGNLILHRDIFTKIPFDPAVPRGEDIDFLINARMFGYEVFLDNHLSIKHEPPSKTSPLWRRVREDIVRFVFEKRKLDTQRPQKQMTMVSAENLLPYPGEFLTSDLQDRIYKSNQMLAIEYLAKADQDGARECLNNIIIGKHMASQVRNPFYRLLDLQAKWAEMMAFFDSNSMREELLNILGLERGPT